MNKRFTGRNTIFIINFIISFYCIGLCNYSEAFKIYKGEQSCYRGEPKNCKCDSLCHFFNDCCEEVLINNDLEAADVTPRSEILWTCFEGLFFIDKCPTNSSVPKNIISGCENASPSEGILRTVPAYSNANKLLFKNAYCAVCNGHFNFTLAEVTGSKCFGQVNMTDLPPDIVAPLIENGTCQLMNHIEVDYRRICDDPMILQCPPDMEDTELQEQCESLPAWNVKSFTHFIFYRNQYCCKCYNDTCLDSGPGSLKGFGGQGRNWQGFEMQISYSLFFDFNRWCGSSCKSELRAVSGRVDQNANVENEANSTFFSNLDINSTEGNVSVRNETTVKSDLKWATVVSYLNVIFSFVSIVALCLLIVIYSLFQELRNFGGLITLALASSLLCGQSVFVINSLLDASGIICKVLGAILHASYLTIFFWMALFAFDLLKTFYSDISGNRSANHISKFALFSVIAYGIPCLIVFLCCTLDTFLPESVLAPAYGQPSCWFNHLWGGVIWFILPVCMILLFNLFACIASICYIYKTNKVAKHARSSRSAPSTSLVFLCVRLTTLFGLFWLMQLVSVFLGSAILNELTGLFNSLQGFFLGICFLATKRVRTMAISSISRTSSMGMSDRTSGNPRLSRPVSCGSHHPPA